MDSIVINITETPADNVTIIASSPDSIPTGGAEGQVLVKRSGSNYDTQWKSIVTALRTQTITTSSTPQPNCDTADQFNITALNEDCEIQVPTGTPVDGQSVRIRIKAAVDSEVSFVDDYRFRESDTIPSVLADHTVYFDFVWNGVDAKWDCLKISAAYVTAAPPAPGFDPTLYGLVRDRFQFNTNQSISGGFVNAWTGVYEGNVLAQVTGSKKPVARAGAIITDGVDDCLVCTGFTNSPSYSIAMLVNVTRAGTAMFGVYGGGDFTTVACHIGMHQSAASDIISVAGKAAVDYVMSKTKMDIPVEGMDIVLFVTYQDGDGYAKIYIDAENQDLDFEGGSIIQTSVTGSLFVGGIAGLGFTEMKVKDITLWKEALSAGSVQAATSAIKLQYCNYTPIGTIFESSDPTQMLAAFTFSDPTKFSNVGGKLLCDGATQPYFYLTGPTFSISRWLLEIDYEIPVIDSASYGLELGNPNGFRHWIGIMYSHIALKGKIQSFSNGGNQGTTAVAANISSGDPVTISYRLDHNIYRIKAMVLAGGAVPGSFVTQSKYIDLSSVPANPPTSSAQIGAYILGGTFKITRIKIFSLANRDPYLLAFMDSIDLAAGQGGPGTSWLSQLCEDPNDHETIAGFGQTTSDALARKDEITRFNPTYVILRPSINDPTNGILRATTAANLETLRLYFEGLGYTVIFRQSDPYVATDMRPYNADLETAYASTHLIIRSYNRLADPMDNSQPNAALFYDTGHPNRLGAAEIAAEAKATVPAPPGGFK